MIGCGDSTNCFFSPLIARHIFCEVETMQFAEAAKETMYVFAEESSVAVFHTA